MNTLNVLLLKRRAITTLAAVTIGATLGACGGSDDSTQNPEIPDGSTPNAQPLARAATGIGDTFVADGLVNVLLSSNAVTSVATQDRDGMTLYVFDNDTTGSSSCVSEGCITAWPPLLADANVTAEAPLSIITRDDGNLQWALRGKPLYFYVDDVAPGDTVGEGVAGTWHAAVSQPTALSTAINDDGAYFTANGEVLVGIPETETSTDSFVATRLDRTNYTLYTYSLDTYNVSTCTDFCLTTWPPLLADAQDIAKPPYSIIEREMNSNGGTALQWAYHGMPLYFSSTDDAGSTSGQNNSRWNLTRPMPWVVTDSERGSILSASGLVLSAEPDSANDEVTQSLGKDGFTLYTWDNDTAGQSSVCNDDCLTSWPALMAHEGAEAKAPFSLIARADTNQMQWALDGMPLYFFANDTAAGDINGDEVNNWHIARTAPVTVRTINEQQVFVGRGNLIDVDGNEDNTHQDHTLYTFANDVVNSGASACNEGCSFSWIPLYASSDDKNFGDFTIITREDNTLQWAYQGSPLYFSDLDSAPDETGGESAIWPLATP